MCSELLQESESTGRQEEQRQSPEETGMVCVWRWDGVCMGGCAFMCVCVGGGFVQSPEGKLVCVCLESLPNKEGGRERVHCTLSQ